jgi:hypothetical protein
MIFMSTTPIFYRVTRKVFINPEDWTRFVKGESINRHLWTENKMEYVLRAHLNGLENIVPFLMSTCTCWVVQILLRILWSMGLPHSCTCDSPSTAKESFGLFCCYWIWTYFFNGLQVIDYHTPYQPVEFFKILDFQFMINIFSCIM